MRSPPGLTSTMHVPVGSSASAPTRRSTPSSALSASERAASSPARAISVTSTPARASHAAVFAPDPPGRSEIRAGVSDATASGAS